jgi:hypothetical protein
MKVQRIAVVRFELTTSTSRVVWGRAEEDSKTPLRPLVTGSVHHAKEAFFFVTVCLEHHPKPCFVHAIAADRISKMNHISFF